MDNPVMACEKNIEEIKTIPTTFNEKIINAETKNFYVLLAFLSITFAILIAIRIYFCLVKYKAKQKHLFLYYVRNNKLKEVL